MKKARFVFAAFLLSVMTTFAQEADLVVLDDLGAKKKSFNTNLRVFKEKASVKDFEKLEWEINNQRFKTAWRYEVGDVFFAFRDGKVPVDSVIAALKPQQYNNFIRVMLQYDRIENTQKLTDLFRNKAENKDFYYYFYLANYGTKNDQDILFSYLNNTFNNEEADPYSSQNRVVQKSIENHPDRFFAKSLHKWFVLHKPVLVYWNWENANKQDSAYINHIKHCREYMFSNPFREWSYGRACISVCGKKELLTLLNITIRRKFTRTGNDLVFQGHPEFDYISQLQLYSALGYNEQVCKLLQRFDYTQVEKLNALNNVKQYLNTFKPVFNPESALMYLQIFQKADTASWNMTSLYKNFQQIIPDNIEYNPYYLAHKDKKIFTLKEDLKNLEYIGLINAEEGNKLYERIAQGNTIQNYERNDLIVLLNRGFNLTMEIETNLDNAIKLLRKNGYAEARFIYNPAQIGTQKNTTTAYVYIANNIFALDIEADKYWGDYLNPILKKIKSDKRIYKNVLLLSEKEMAQFKRIYE